MPDQADVQTTHADPLLADFELSRSAVFYPLGYPLHIETNSREVIAAASARWSDFSPRGDDQPSHLSLAVSESLSTRTASIPSYRSRDHLLSMVCDAENHLTCDLNTWFAFGWITPATVSDPMSLLPFIEAAPLILVQQRYLAVVHAALIQLNGCGVLLCGETRAGKSTLSYACARAGWTLISDDATSLIRDRDDLYGIGNPHSLRFREDAKVLFPELEKWTVTARLNGKLGFEVLTNQLPGISTAEGCTIDHVVFLNRREPGPKLVRFETEAALSWFEQFSCYGPETIRDSQRKAYRRLARAATWELRYRSLDEAMARLKGLVDGGA